MYFMEDAGEQMKRGTKKAGNRMEEGAEEAKDKVDQSIFLLFFDPNQSDIF